MRKFSTMLQVIMKENEIPLKHFSKVLSTIIYIANRLPLSGMITGNMNVCQNVRIKTFYSEDFEL
jgi:hypothetical protein